MTAMGPKPLSTCSIRLATIEDAELLAELGARTFSETFAADNTAANMAAYLAKSFNSTQQHAELSDPNGWLKIAEIDRRAVGYAMMHSGRTPAAITGEKPVELVRLYVLHESIGSGIGAALMQDCLNETVLRSYKTIWLGVWDHNHRAQAFYRKWNFREVGTHIFKLGDDEQTDLLMQREL